MAQNDPNLDELKKKAESERLKADIAEARARQAEADARSRLSDHRVKDRTARGRFGRILRATMLTVGIALTGAGVGDAARNWLEWVDPLPVITLGTGVAASSGLAKKRQGKTEKDDADE